MKLLQKSLIYILPVTASALAGGLYYQNYHPLQSFASCEASNQTQLVGFEQQHNHSNSFTSNNKYCSAKWDFNWDGRQPHSMLNLTKYNAADEDKKQEMLKDVTPTATRHIFLIRHGQYVLGKGEKYLTPLGKEQAKLLGQRLNATKIIFDNVHVSTMNRARETATLALQEITTFIEPKLDCMLEEGAPCMPEPEHPDWNPKPVKFFTEGARIEAAFRKHIHRASPKQKKDSNELYICHGNVIRYFVCRALQFPVKDGCESA
uniref:Serine/threonine-protein phosphatase PGAM5, mitochondrial n=1 Tax=Ditylenchus dipsaci TaxID=166011 RepID=A0A915ENP5_9BILA